MFKKTFVLMALLIVSLSGIFVRYSHGQKYPARPVEIVVPYTPGSPMDIMSRLVAETAPKYLGQPVTVVNKPGAGGSIAAADVISSKPDGYKIFNPTVSFFAMTTKTQKVPFDPGLLAPLVNFIEYKEGVCVRGDSPFKTFNELLDYARKNPGKLRWAHSGRGISAHVAVLLIFRKAGVETIDVPYKGTPEKVAALLGGHVDASGMTYGTVKDHAKAGKIRFLIFISNKRYSDPPNVPTVVDLGFPEVAGLRVLSGYYVHKDTSDEIKNTLIDAFKKIYDDPGFKKEFEGLGDEPLFGGPEFVREAIKKCEEIGVPILKELGLYVEK